MVKNSYVLLAATAPIPAANVSSGDTLLRRVVLAATIGNTLEWYDFLVYGFLSLTIGKVFFPTGSELSSLLFSVATFGVGFVMRPIGAVVLGIYSDRIGRKAALTLTIFIMALGTGLIALAPTYDSIGIWAPLLIAVSRLLQGFSCGGEFGGATAILAENAPDVRSTAVSLVYNLTATVVGGFAPFIVTWLIAATGNPLAPALYVVSAAVISAAAILGLRDRFREPLG
jgi:MHS family proline/betaine transporter-like MFS transporter